MKIKALKRSTTLHEIDWLILMYTILKLFYASVVPFSDFLENAQLWTKRINCVVIVNISVCWRFIRVIIIIINTCYISRFCFFYYMTKIIKLQYYLQIYELFISMTFQSNRACPVFGFLKGFCFLYVMEFKYLIIKINYQTRLRRIPKEKA
jgi:hypothetical protein